MPNSKDLPINDSSTGENPDERAKTEDAASRPPEASDASPLSPRDNYEFESARAQDGDQALTVVGESYIAAVRYPNREIGTDIGHYAGMLSQLNLQLGPGISVPHKAVQLYEMLPGDSEAKTHALRDLQRELGGVLTKSGMEKKLSALKNATLRANQKGIGTPDGNNSDGQPETEPIKVDLLLFTPGPDRSVVAHFAENRPKSRLNIGLLRPNAIAVVITTARDYAAGWAQLLPRWGLKHIANFLLTKMPDGPDIGNEEIVVLATDSVFSAMRFHLENDNWIQDVQDRDWRTVVDRLIPDAVYKRHMFAADHAEGWDCVIGEENWKAK